MYADLMYVDVIWHVRDVLIMSMESNTLVMPRRGLERSASVKFCRRRSHQHQNLKA